MEQVGKYILLCVPWSDKNVDIPEIICFLLSLSFVCVCVSKPDHWVLLRRSCCSWTQECLCSAEHLWSGWKQLSEWTTQTGWRGCSFWCSAASCRHHTCHSDVKHINVWHSVRLLNMWHTVGEMSAIPFSLMEVSEEPDLEGKKATRVTRSFSVFVYFLYFLYMGENVSSNFVDL